MFFLFVFCALLGASQARPQVIDFEKENLVAFFCSNDTDCHSVFNATKVKCDNGSCVCLDTETGKPTPCKTKDSNIQGQINGSCPCLITNSYCETKLDKCLCNPNFSVSENKRACIPDKVQLGSPCEFHQQCIKYDRGAICNHTKKVCECDHGFVLHKNACFSRIDIGNPCLNTEECQSKTPNSFCEQRTCVCQEDFVANKANSSCLHKSGFGEACQETAQCEKGIGPGVVCDNGLCICLSNHYNYTDDSGLRSCQRRILIGDSCEEHNECFSINDLDHRFECKDKRCACRHGFVEKNAVCIPSGVSRSNLSLLTAIAALFVLLFSTL